MSSPISPHHTIESMDFVRRRVDPEAMRDIADKLWKCKEYKLTPDEELVFAEHGTNITLLVRQKIRSMLQAVKPIWGSGVVNPEMYGMSATTPPPPPCGESIKFLCTPEVTVKPERKHEGDAGYDVAALKETIIPPYKTGKVSTGLYVIPPHGIYLEIKDRSSLASRGKITVGGVIDNHYRGELFICLYNSTDTPMTIAAGDRIAQLVPRRLYDRLRPEYYTADDDTIDWLQTSTLRGTGGFGSTGV
jgi:dUTP pyrophosphatase